MSTEDALEDREEEKEFYQQFLRSRALVAAIEAIEPGTRREVVMKALKEVEGDTPALPWKVDVYRYYKTPGVPSETYRIKTLDELNSVIGHPFTENRMIDRIVLALEEPA